MKDGSLAGQIFPRDGSVLGKTTISVTGISKSFFHQRRRGHVRKLWLAFIALGEAVEAGDNNLIATTVNRFEIMLSSGSEFSGLAREFVRKMRLDAEYELTIPDIH